MLRSRSRLMFMASEHVWQCGKQTKKMKVVLEPNVQPHLIVIHILCERERCQQSCILFLQSTQNEKLWVYAKYLYDAHGAGELPEQVFHLWRPAALQRGDQSKHKNVSNICFSVQITADTILLKWRRMRPTTQHVIRKYFLSLMFYWNIMGTRKHVQLTQ